MDPSELRPPEEITRDERTTAMLAHVLTIFAGFFAPGIIWLVKQRDSKFIAFHSIQAFLWHLLFFVASMVGVVAAFATVVATIAAGSGAPPAGGDSPPPAFLFGFFGLWIVAALGWVANVCFCIYLGVRASEGKWTRYPLVGSLAIRLAGLRG